MPAPTTCLPEPDLVQFVHGDLDAHRLQQIAEHVDHCDSCQDTVVALAERSDTFVDAIRKAAADKIKPQESALQLGLRRMLASLRLHPEGAVPNTGLSPVTTASNLHLGPYLVQEQLGSGGMGHVYRATHTRLKRTVALKVLPNNRWSNTLAVSRFEREMEAIGQLDHPHIVRASDAGEDQGMHYLVMEYVDGLDLSRLVNRLGPLPTADACQLARQAAIGLHYAHDRGLIHRDVKPSNLILAWERPSGLASGATPTLKILDLGLALLGDEHLQAGHELTTVGTLMGTLDYMSPEQGIDSHGVDQRTDIYGLGATLFKLLTGRAPYADPQHSTLMKKMTALATKAAPSLGAVRADLSEDLVTIVDQMIARDPDERYASARDVAEALAQHIEGADLTKLLQRGVAADDPADAVAPRVPVTALATSEATADAATARQSSGSDHRKVSGWRLLLGAAMLAVAGGVLFRMATNFGDLVIHSNDPNATVVVKRGGKKTNELRLENKEETIRLWAGDYQLEVIGDAEVTIIPSDVEVQRGSSTSVRVTGTGAQPQGESAASFRNQQQARGLYQALQNSHETEGTHQPAEVKGQVDTHPDNLVAPGTIGIGTRFYVKVSGTLPQAPIEGVFALEPSGKLHLGLEYGRVHILGMSYEQAEKVIEDHLREMLSEPSVMVTHPPLTTGNLSTGVNPIYGHLGLEEPSSEPTFEGKPYGYWLGLVRTERQSRQLVKPIEAIGLLGSSNPSETAKTLLKLMRNFGDTNSGLVEPQVFDVLAALDPHAVVAAMIEEFSAGNATSRDSMHRFVQHVLLDDRPFGDHQRLRVTWKAGAAELAQARLASQQSIDLERSTVERFLTTLARSFDLDPHTVPGMLDVLQETLDEEISRNNVDLHLEVANALAEFTPETPGLVERILELRSWHRSQGGGFEADFAQLAKQLGTRATPMLNELIDELELSLQADLLGIRVLSPIIETLGEMGPAAKPAINTIQRIVELAKQHAELRSTSRIAEAALAKIHGDRHPASFGSKPPSNLETELLKNELAQAELSLNVAHDELRAARAANKKVPGSVTESELVRLQAQAQQATLVVEKIQLQLKRGQ